MALEGIDVSRYQGTINWEAVRRSNIQFAMIRAGYGRNNIDPTFRQNIEACNRLGIPCGVYWFSYALNTQMAREEARYCLAAIRRYRLDYPVCFDLEYDTIAYAARNGVTIGRRLATDMVKAFCNEVRSAGYLPMYYSNRDYINNVFYPNELTDYLLWYALYRNTLDRTDVAIWQYTENGTVSGINGSVDLNLSFLQNGVVVSPSTPPTINTGSRSWVSRLQSEINAQGRGPVVVDGIPGPATLQALPTVRPGARGNFTRLIQEHLGISSPDGIFGPNTEQRVKAFQRNMGLVSDGIVGRSTWQRLLGI